MRYSQLEDLIHEYKPKCIVEVGTHNGLRAWRMCIAALEHHDQVTYTGYDLFDLANAETDEREMNGKGAGSIKKVDSLLRSIKQSHHGFNYNLVKGDTRETLHGNTMVNVDFAFIDGGHSIETIRGDYEALKRAKVIVFDDYYVSGMDTSKFGCNELVDGIHERMVELLPKIDNFGNGLQIQMAVVR